MSAKIGRPVIGKPKTIDLKVRIDDDTHELLLEYCKSHNITKAEVVRKAIELFLDK